MEPIQIEDLYRQRGQIHRLACALVGESDADDVVQEAMTAALARKSPPLHWGRWLTGVTRHISWRRTSERRGQRRRLERHAEDQGWATETETSPEELVAEVEAKNALERAVLDQDEPYRSVLLWRFYEDLSIEEISRRSGTPPSTTRTRLMRGLERLRARMSSERGPDWRLALAPLLMRRPAEVALPGTAAAAGVTLMSLATLKWTAALSGAAALLAFLPRVLQDDPDLARLAEPDLGRVELEDLAAPEPVTESLELEVREEVAVLPDEEVAVETAAAAAEPDARLVDRESGVALAGVQLDVEVHRTTGKFIFKRRKTYEATVLTDAEGRFTLPGPGSGAKEATEPDYCHARIAAERNGLYEISCVAAEEENGGRVLHPDVAFACRVKLPVGLSMEERAAAIFGLSLNEGNDMGQGLGIQLRPGAVTADELTILFPRLAMQRTWEEGKSVGTLKIATTAQGPAFTATFDSLPSLLDAPLEAVPSDSVLHAVRVVNATTGEPIGGVHVNVAPETSRMPYGPDGVSATTGDDGVAELIGVPASGAVVYLQKRGFERHEEPLTALAGGTSEIQLEPTAGLRSVDVTIRSARGEAPMLVWCVVTAADASGAAHEAVTPVKEGAGWSASFTLETIPSQRCTVEVQTPGSTYDLERHWFLEPQEDALTIDVGEARETIPVLVEAPEGLKYDFVMGVGPGRRGVSEHEGTEMVRMAPIDGTPVTWTLEAEGHVPLIGTEADWEVTEVDGRRVARIRGTFEPGWGRIVFANRLAPADDGRGGELPYHMRAELPLAGVVLLDGPEGRRVGSTNDRGLAVIQAGERPEAIWYRFEGETRRRKILGDEGTLEIRP